MNTVIMRGQKIALLDNKLNVGDDAPNFVVIDKNLNEVNLKDFYGTPIVLTTFPSIDTGVCEMQVKKFNQKIAEFKTKAKLMLVSNDLPFAQNRFCGVNKIDNAIVLSAHRDEKFARSYGILLDKIRLLARATFIIDKNGKLAYIEIVENVSNEPNYEKALDVLKKLID